MTFRAVEVLKSVDLILAEDTRTTGILLAHYDIRKPLQSHHKFNEHQKVNLVKERLAAGESIALVSDAGTPGISDPGFLLVRACIAEGIQVQTLPGATALIPALVDSGLPCDRFCFEGFLPRKKGLSSMLDSLAGERRTMIFYESPYRLVKTLGHMAEHFGAERECSVVREISKKFEQAVHGTLESVIAHFTSEEPRGEIVIIVKGSQ